MTSEQTTKENATMNARKNIATSRSLGRRLALVWAALTLLACLAPAAEAAATPSPGWLLSVTPHPTNLQPGSSLETQGPQYYLHAVNVGGAPTSGPVTITDTVSGGLEFGFGFGRDDLNNTVECEAEGETITCIDEADVAPLQPGEQIQITALLEGIPAGASGTVTSQATITGGGAPADSAENESRISAEDAPFEFIDGFAGLNATVYDSSGAPETVAGTHPSTLRVASEFPSAKTGPILNAVHHQRDIRIELPPGLTVNPNATPVRCTEAQLESDLSGEGCPPASQIGTLAISTILGVPTTGPAPLYNMVPPPGHTVEFGLDVVGLGLYVHLMAGVRYHDGYRLYAGANDIGASLPILGTQVTLWSDPADPSHDALRGHCANEPADPGCPVAAAEPTPAPLLTTATSCPGPQTTNAVVDSWEDPGAFLSNSYTSSGSLSGCDELKFAPTLVARPTTDVGDSPTGLSVDIHVPQTTGQEERATANLRKTVVTLPEGLTLNPSSANGLESCSSAQVGIDPVSGEPDNNHVTCPDASRIGEIEVTTPLLPNALPGSVYVATPYDNPFDSLLAIYAVVDDPQTGVLLKLAGHVEPDPNTGRLVTTFDDNPQLPFNDFKLSFFGGAGAVLRTPSVCGTYSTTSEMTPWSAPQSGPPAVPSDSYPISANCAAGEGGQPSKPEFEAGAEAPIAGKYTPFNIHLKREDGSQQFSQLTITPPPGLVAKLADTPACSAGALAGAEAKTGRDEEANPSCSSASRIGAVHVGAGAGPAPYYANGVAYLAGPYKGAPLSMAIITPAVAGPFDLGTVVTRVALHVDPATAQITADADPIPHILKGIVLDVRSIDLALDKPEFTRTGTSCDPFAVKGLMTSTLGQGAGLESRYQLGNCANLSFNPSFDLRLIGPTKRNRNPKLVATLNVKEGEANIAGAAVRLARSSFLDQSHIRTVCTRVQFAASAGNGAECPAGSIYGRASARSPLLGYELSGNVYLRSSDNKLPDLVVALQGPASQPIAIDLDGRTDSVKGALRNTFETVPDAPVSAFRLELFGGKRGLIVNSRDICAHPYRANVDLLAQNGAHVLRHPAMKAQCRGKSGKSRGTHKHGDRKKSAGR